MPTPLSFQKWYENVEWRFVDQVPPSHSKLYVNQQLPCIIELNSDGGLIISVSRFLKNSEKKLAIIRGIGYADFYRRNKFMKSLLTPNQLPDMQLYKERYGSNIVEQWQEAFQSIGFTLLKNDGSQSLYEFILTYNDQLLDWQKQLGEELISVFKNQAIEHSTAIIREGWAAHWQMKWIKEHANSKTEAIEFARVITQKSRKPGTGIHLDQLGKALLDAVPRNKINQVMTNYRDVDLLDRFYTEELHLQERISIAFNHQARQTDYKNVKSFLMDLSNQGFLPILTVDQQKTLESGELTVYHKSFYPIDRHYLQQVRQSVQTLWKGKVFFKPSDRI